MQVKIDTSENFHVITILEHSLSANMTGEMENTLYSVLKEDIKNVIVNLENVETADTAMLNNMIAIQRTFIGNRASFICSGLQPQLRTALKSVENAEELHVVPTQSEASDMILMDEIERELEED